jgi:hypothetical protein
MLLWPRLVCGASAVLRSSPGPRLPKLYGRQPLVAPGALLGSPFNVKWRFSVPAGDVEESKLCLFSVIMPAKCVSSVSPRFHYRRVAFCFLPLAAILEFFHIYTFNLLDFIHEDLIPILLSFLHFPLSTFTTPLQHYFSLKSDQSLCISASPSFMC